MHMQKDLGLDISTLGVQELKALSSAVLIQATKTVNSELQDLLLQKERIEHELDRK